MSRWRRTTDAVARPLDHIEIWGYFVKVHRFQRRVTVAALGLAFVGLVAAIYTATTALASPLVYYVDPEGHAQPGGRIANAASPAEVEARYVAKRFLQLTIGLNSVTVQRDFAAAWNLMSEALRREHDAELASYERERGRSFIDFIKERMTRTELSFRDIVVSPTSDGGYHVRAFGRARTWPLNAVGGQAGYADQDFEASLTLVRVARTELSPNGLLVNQRTLRWFEAATEADTVETLVPNRRQ
jgi:hypothetical protein